MPKQSLTKTNPYLLNPMKRREMFEMTVYTSTEVEGIKLPLPTCFSEQGLLAESGLPVNLQGSLDHSTERRRYRVVD